jgi:type VI secretion system protein ImpK
MERAAIMKNPTAPTATQTTAVNGVEPKLSIDDRLYIVELFEHFVGELQRVRRYLEVGEIGQALMADVNDATALCDSGDVIEQNGGRVSSLSDGGPAADEISMRLCNLLQRYAFQMSRRFGSFGAAMFAEAQYLMAALADEFFIHEVDWCGAREWRSHPIEAQLFGSHNAGNAVYSRIDDLLARRDPGQSELAQVYLFALQLNFQGRYRGDGGAAATDAYRLRLHNFVTNRAPRLHDSDYRTFGEAYEPTSDLPVGESLPHARRWVFAIVLVLMLYVTFSHVIWSENIGVVLDIIGLDS